MAISVSVLMCELGLILTGTLGIWASWQLQIIRRIGSSDDTNSSISYSKSDTPSVLEVFCMMVFLKRSLSHKTNSRCIDRIMKTRGQHDDILVRTRWQPDHGENTGSVWSISCCNSRWQIWAMGIPFSNSRRTRSAGGWLGGQWGRVIIVINGHFVLCFVFPNQLKQISHGIFLHILNKK